MPFELIHSEKAYQGRNFSVRRDEVRLPDGETARLDIVDHVDSVVLIPLDGEGRIHFVRQYRHAAGKDLLELPAGTLNPGEDPLECARREIREEIGLAADEFRELGAFYLAPGYSTEFMHVYLATGLHSSPLDHDEDEFLEALSMPAGQALELARSGNLPDAKSLAALLLSGPLLGPGSADARAN